jgi:hypothetical protein
MGHPGPVIADLIGRPPVAVQIAPVLALLHDAGHRGLEREVEADRLGAVGLQPHPDPSQRFDDLVVDRPSGDAVGIGRERPARPYGPLLPTSGDAGVRIDDVAVRVFPEAEADLDRPSRAAAMPHTFSVHAGSDRPAVANVSTIWCVKPSSAATSGPVDPVMAPGRPQPAMSPVPSRSMTRFPTTPSELTADVLTDYLRASGHLTSGNAVTSVVAELIGTGKMGDNARLTLAYDRVAGDAPATVIAKLPATDERARTLAGGAGAYYNEVMFYRLLAGRTEMRTPTIHASEISDDRTSFLLLMEDLSPAEPGSQLVGESRRHAVDALHEVAKLAAAFHDDESIAALDHVSTSRDDGGLFVQALVQDAWPGFVDRFGHGMSAESVAFGERYVANHARFASRYDGPKTLVHGDFRSENILFGSGAPATVDWQTTVESSPLTDAAYFLGGSLEIDDRRTWERELVEEYRAALATQGVEIEAGGCWDLYREYSMHGIVITVLGATYSTPDSRSDEMFLAMIQRHLQQCVDLGSGEFLA